MKHGLFFSIPLGVLTVVMVAGCGSPSTQQVVDTTTADTVPADAIDTASDLTHDGDVADVGDMVEEEVVTCIPTGEEVCDGVDNDCDGATDEDFSLATDPNNCGTCGYVCVTPNGTPGCTSGKCVVETCDEGFYNINGSAHDGCEYACTPTGTEEGDCEDGLDADCDGRIDGDDPDCSECVPEFCDEADNDCDDLIDEDFNLREDPLNCGTCGNTCPPRPNADPACVLGECTITCQPGYSNVDLDDINGCEAECEVTGMDEFECDGVDDDCDGLVDEDYIPYSCGVGYCVTASICWKGEETCEPVDPLAPEDTICDNVDEDCDGSVDEDFVPSDLCVGLCKTNATCEDGVEICGEPEDLDASCDGVDDDCDGTADDDYVPYTCGTGGCTRQSTCIGGIENCVEGGPAPEICNGSDDDCDDIIDNGDPASLCDPPPPHGTGECVEGSCVIGGCEETYFDTDGVYGNGCECVQETTEDSSTTCEGAYDLGTFQDTGTTTTVNGNIVPGGDSDWYKFHAQDSGDTSGDAFDVVVAFTANPGGVFRMDVYRGDCSDASPCLNVNDQMEWFTNISTGSMDAKVGECPCRTAAAEHDFNQCSDNSADFYVRVYRAAGAPVTCDNYTITISNGLEGCSP